MRAGGPAMSSDTVRAFAVVVKALSDLASALQRETTESEPMQTMSLGEAVKRYGIPRSTLTELIAQRQIEAARVGRGRGRYYVTPQAVEAYLARRTTRAKPHPLVREAV